MLNPANMRAESLRKEALNRVRSEKYDEAIELYDLALSLANDEELRELLSINKAHALIAMGRGGAEVQSLPLILMQRRNVQHTFLAAYGLLYKHRMQNDIKRAIFYGEVALSVAIDADNPFWKIGVLNDLGIACEMDSQFDRAIAQFELALTLVGAVEDEYERDLSEAAIIPNLAYNKILSGRTVEGLRMMHDILDRIQSPSGLADSYIALCHGYLEIEQYDDACRYGEIGLELATNPREVRNAHYMIGEAAYKAGDTERAERHFEELAKFYPEFRNLKSLLFALDLRSMVNFRL
jgi:tetratricopeptide (TPR) repeat protein